MKEVRDAFGKVLFLYHPIVDYQRSGVFYYVLPWAYAILLGRRLRKVWLFPLMLLWKAGLAYVPPGERTGLFWPRYVWLWYKMRNKI